MRKLSYPMISAQEAAAMIPDGASVGFSGFTPAGAAKVVPRALAEKAKALHAEGKPYKLRVLTGASTGEACDEALAQADAISWRTPYQTSRTLRKQLNNGQVSFVDMHLSHMPQMLLEGFFGKLDYAVVEITDVTADGRVYLSTSVGASPTFLQCADKIILEINRYHSPRLSQVMDIATLPMPPHRSPVAIYHPMQKLGWPYVGVDPKKIVGVVESNEPDGVAPFTTPDQTSSKIADNVINFILKEMEAKRIPPEFLPIQSGVGNIANAVMSNLGKSDKVPPFHMYTEVMQDSVVDLMRQGLVEGVSTTALTLSDEKMQEVYKDFDFFASRILLRPQEYSNNPGIVRRLGVITTNTALEVDIYGHVNSTHVSGTQMMNGIGGSADFTRNAYLSIFMCPSVAKGGKISTIVPMVSHVDHSEHSVQVVITDQGVADLRGLSPNERARVLIDHCAHPAYRPYLWDYVNSCPQGHIRHNFDRVFELHQNLIKNGQMLPDFPSSES